MDRVLEPLAEEARKYKSAEEFVSKNIPSHITNNEIYSLTPKISEGKIGRAYIVSYHGTTPRLEILVPFENTYTAKTFAQGIKEIKRYLTDFYNQVAKAEVAPVTPEVTTPPWLKCPKCGGRLYRVPGAIYEGEQQYSHFYRISDVFRGLSTCNYIAKVKLADLSKIPKATTEIASLSWYSISELKQMCQQKGLSTEGSKEDLIRRLRRL